MRVGVLGTGMVGAALATRLVEVGHDVVMGSRAPDNEKAMAWAASRLEGAAAGTFADAASHGEVVVNATSGIASLAALTAAGEERGLEMYLVLWIALRMTLGHNAFNIRVVT